MKARIYQPSDYDTLCKFWNDHNFPPVPESFIPRNGIVITINDKVVAGGFLFMDCTTPIGWVEFVVVDAELTPRTSHKAVKLLLEEIGKLAKFADLKILMCFVKSKGLIKMYEKNGFVTADSETTNMIKAVK